MNNFLDSEAALMQEEFDRLENQIQERISARKPYIIRPRLDPMHELVDRPTISNYQPRTLRPRQQRQFPGSG